MFLTKPINIPKTYIIKKYPKQSIITFIEISFENKLFLLSYPKNKKVSKDIPTQYNIVTIVKLISILKTLNKVTKAIYNNIYITCKTDTFNKPFSILSLLNVLKINI